MSKVLRAEYLQFTILVLACIISTAALLWTRIYNIQKATLRRLRRMHVIWAFVTAQQQAVSLH
jgi:hypothetical protein